MKKSKLLIIVLSLVLLITGCSNKGISSTSTGNSKGRYVENNVTLPEGLNASSLQLTKKNGLPFLYSFITTSACTITGYQMNSDGTWTEDTPEWLKSLSLPEDASFMAQVVDDINGNQYLYYTELLNDSLKGHLLRSTDKITYETLSPEGWDEVDPEYNIYRSPGKIAILDNGTIAALFNNMKVEFYNKDTLEKQNSITDMQNSNTILSASDHSVILAQTDGNDNIISVDAYDTANQNKKTSYPFQSTLPGYSYLDINEAKDIMICNPDGIHVLKQDTSLWQTVVDGTLTSLAMKSLWSNGFVAGEDGNYYVLFHSDSGYSFMKYTYDETIDTVPSTELTVYALKDNSTLRQAAAVFQQTHPDVRISFKVAMTEEEYSLADTTTKEDFIKALNTELLAGGGEDILVLDGLPADSFIEKGVLADLSDIIQPMLDNDELFSNIINSYLTEGKIYSVPARFSLQILCGRTADTKKLTTLETLSEYVADHNDTSLLGTMTVDDFINTFSPYLTKKIMGTDGKIDKEKLVTLLNQLKIVADNCGIVDTYSDESGYHSPIWDLASRIQLSFNQCDGFLSSMYSIGVVTYVNGGYTPFENAFTPSCEIGINNASKNTELCKEFISLVLSEDIGKNDFYDGFSINKKGLNLCSQADRSNYAACIGIENADGTYGQITCNALNAKQAGEFADYCSMVTDKTETDDQITLTFKEETKDFFLGNLSVGETADNIIEKTEVYLSE